MSLLASSLPSLYPKHPCLPSIDQAGSRHLLNQIIEQRLTCQMLLPGPCHIQSVPDTVCLTLSTQTPSGTAAALAGLTGVPKRQAGGCLDKEAEDACMQPILEPAPDRAPQAQFGPESRLGEQKVFLFYLRSKDLPFRQTPFGEETFPYLLCLSSRKQDSLNPDTLDVPAVAPLSLNIYPPFPSWEYTLGFQPQGQTLVFSARCGTLHKAVARYILMKMQDQGGVYSRPLSQAKPA